VNDREIERRLPWFASGAEEPSGEERRLLERRLAGSAKARELEALARLLADPAAPRETDLFSGEIHPRLLIEYVETPETLDEETRRWIEERLAESPVHRAEVKMLERVEKAIAGTGRREPAAAARSEGRFAVIWHRLSHTVLHPVAATGYLAAAAALALFSLLPVAEREPSAPAHAPGVLPMWGDTTFRDRPQPSDQPVQQLTRSTRPVALWLDVGLTREDLDDPRTSFHLELNREDQQVWSEPVTSDRFVEDDGRCNLLVLISTETLATGVEYQIVLRINRPGDPLDGQALFRGRFAVLD
jgi:hypothetical protein